MRLIKCYIESFGRLREYSCEFDRGLNCLASANGTGKSTLATFIKAMLYGLPDGRKASLSENERKKYNPWQGGRYGGSLTLEASGKVYTIERSFGQRPAEDSLRVIDARTGTVCRDLGEVPGEELFGIDRDGFERTVFLSERSLQGKNENRTIAARLSDVMGADGDVEGVDDAIALLEERRKIYFKKGGAGLIAELNRELSLTEREIERLERVADSAKECERELARLSAERASVISARDRADALLSQINESRSLDGVRATYRASKERLAELKARLYEIDMFLGSPPPTAEELERAWEDDRESRRLYGSMVSTEGYTSSPYSTLTRSEVERIRRAKAELDEIEEELAEISSETDELSREANELFRGEAPTRDEIDKAIAKNRRGGRVTGTVFLSVGLALLTAGAFTLGITAISYALLGIGGAASVIGIIILASGGGRVCRELIDRLPTAGPRKMPDDLYELSSRRERYDALLSKREKRRELLDERSSSIRRDILDFISRYPTARAETVEDTLTVILDGYDEYTRSNAAVSGNADILAQAEKKRAMADGFLARFHTRTENPFGEIREKITERGLKEREIELLARELQVTEATYPELMTDPKGTKEGAEAAIAQRHSSEEALRRLDESITLRRREYEQMMTEIEALGEQRAVAQMLREKIEDSKRRLDIIVKTEEMLRLASERMTERYLGKTKDSFVRYVGLFGEERGEFAIDTSFTLTKNERGSMRSDEAYSRGTRDLYALAMRLALVDALYEKEKPFIILDDPFTALDGKRLNKGKEMLKALSGDRQIIYFTCSVERSF